jgi:hypothetical protein
VAQAKMARDCTPSVQDLKAVIRMNCIKNNLVTIADVNLAEKIFGPDIGSLKGKSTRKKLVHVAPDYVEIPRLLMDAQYSVTLCIAGMFVNGLPFLKTISRNIMYRTASSLPNKKPKSYEAALDKVLRLYNLGGFRVERIHCDNEFRPVMDIIIQKYPSITVNYCNAQEHTPEAERNNRTIKERIRATFHRLPYSRLPRIVIQVLTMESAKMSNYFVPKGGVSKFYSPRMIVTKDNLNYNKHCLIPLGTYVQADHEATFKNDNHPCTLDCMYLRYINNDQGGHELLDLRTGKTICHQTVTKVPITTSIIKLVHAIVAQDGMKTGLKLQNRSGKVIY